MSSRSQIKRISLGSRTLKFLRLQSGLSLRAASAISGTGASVINHLEHGRMEIRVRHLEQLLKSYGSTRQTYEMFTSGRVKLPVDLRADCIRIIEGMTLEQIQTLHPLLESLAKSK